jgi:hypothetical protein
LNKHWSKLLAGIQQSLYVNAASQTLVYDALSLTEVTQNPAFFGMAHAMGSHPIISYPHHDRRRVSPLVESDLPGRIGF